MKIYGKGFKPRDNGVRFAFPSVGARLTEEVISKYRLRDALKRVGSHLIKQMKRDYSKEVVGIEITELQFVIILGDD